MKPRSFPKTAALLLAALTAGIATPAPLVAQDFSKMRGAGLIDKQGPGYYPPEKFREGDFQFLKEHGFNFARLPIAYQFWTVAGNPDLIDEAKMKEIDEAIRWGERYGQHVCLCFYSVPGYAVNKPNQNPSLWADEATQKRFLDYWRAFAQRYKAVAPQQLSFNLINEPDWNCPEEAYSRVMRLAIGEIHKIDPNRPIIVDGLKAGREPVMSLADTGVVQAIHFYEPFPFTHYAAPWITDGARLPRPERWPAPRVTEHLFGPQHKGAERTWDGKHTPLVILGPFSSPAVLRLKIGTIAAKPDQPLSVAFLADGKEFARQSYTPPPKGNPPDPRKTSEAWLDADLTGTIPQGTQKVEIWADSGERLTFRELGIRPSPQATETVLTPSGADWEGQVATLRYVAGKPFESDAWFDKAWIRDQHLKHWKPFLDRGGKVMVQEFGCYSQTPHAAVANYLKDCTSFWNEQGWGWAIWSLRGPMGLLNNERKDAPSEPWQPGTVVDPQLLRALEPNAK